LLYYGEIITIVIKIAMVESAPPSMLKWYPDSNKKYDVSKQQEKEKNNSVGVLEMCR
jgi:hypothetical protein